MQVVHTPRSAERTVNVRAAIVCVEGRLRRRGSHSGQRGHDGKSDVVGEISRLIETALAPTCRMKGNRYGDAGLQHQILAACRMRSASGFARERRPSYLSAWTMSRRAPA